VKQILLLSGLLFVIDCGAIHASGKAGVKVTPGKVVRIPGDGQGRCDHRTVERERIWQAERRMSKARTTRSEICTALVVVTAIVAYPIWVGWQVGKIRQELR